MNFWMMLAGAVVFALATMVSWTLLQRYWPDGLIACRQACCARSRG
jgi:hypothetical protein